MTAFYFLMHYQQLYPECDFRLFAFIYLFIYFPPEATKKKKSLQSFFMEGEEGPLLCLHRCQAPFGLCSAFARYEIQCGLSALPAWSGLIWPDVDHHWLHLRRPFVWTCPSARQQSASHMLRSPTTFIWWHTRRPERPAFFIRFFFMNIFFFFFFYVFVFTAA